ncbi:glycine cleavage system protein R [Desulfosediminicola flagellatus]|uniref:glycine cleavage system protein R n=1 Tax=Desulfosediminicola flagellatus TaxID=2569541 RepID=UPI0010AC96D6|nr:ACT domain-containing protein [Desulfosediminicola flagellatus]
MKKQMIISVMSKDRPGVIADITGAIYKLDGDLADLNQSVLCNYLNMILIATFSSEVTPEDVVAEISHIKTPVKFEVSIKVMDNPINVSDDPLPPETYIMTAKGQNKSGLVYSVSQFCHSHNINIRDLATTLRDDQYTMILQLDLSGVSSIATVQNALTDFSAETGLKVMMQHNDIFQATHEVTLH